MRRLIDQGLARWKKQRTRNPLLLQGARQVGKTYVLHQFGRLEFSRYHYFNFEEAKDLKRIFEQDLIVGRIVKELSLRLGKDIDIQNDLIIFDEIQECPRALTSLKYFCEEMPEMAICGAGSLLGVKLSEESFPVGKVDFLHLYPLNFEEFLEAVGDKWSWDVFQSALLDKKVPEMGHDRLLGRLKEYFFTGGMPQIVNTYLERREGPMNDLIALVRQQQRNLIDSYSKDFAKHSGKTNSMHIVSVFESVPMQISRTEDGSVNRYKFKGIIPNKRSFADLQGPVDWLERAGLVIKIKICNRAEIPLEAYCRQNIFKLFLFDVGLLGCMLNLPYQSIIDGNYGIAKGYFAENFVAQELLAANGLPLYSWMERNSEIEFLQIAGGEIIPVEVKAGTRTRAKSLSQYLHQYSPKRALKLSTNNLKANPHRVIWEYPIYLAGRIPPVWPLT